MHPMTRFIRPARVFVLVGLGVFFVGCSSDDPTVPPTTPVCDDQNPGGYTISNPEAGHVYVWAGNGLPGAGEMGHLPGYTRLYWPVEVNFDPTGDPIVLDWNNHRVIGLDDAGKFVKLIGHYFGNPDDGPALEADLNHPTHVTFSPDGTKLILCAWHNSIVMEMDLATNLIAKYCGTGGRCFNGDGQARLQSCLDLPVCALFSPADGELYVSDQANHVIRRIDGAGVVHVVAGTAPVSNGAGGWNYQSGYGGDGGLATSALLNLERTQTANPSGKFCFDAAGNLYIADTKNNAVRVVYLDGTIDTFAGQGPGSPGYGGDGGPATLALLYEPRDVAADTDGTIFIADCGNHVIRMVATDGTISTVAGVARPFNSLPISVCDLKSEHGALASEVHLTSPYGIEVDAQHHLWIADSRNNVVRILYR